MQSSVLKLHWKDDADLVHRRSPCHLTVSSATDIDLTFDIVDAFRLSCHLMSLLAVCVMTHYGLRVASFAKVGYPAEMLCKALAAASYCLLLQMN